MSYDTSFRGQARMHFYFDRIASAGEGKRVRGDVRDLRLRDQIESRWAPLPGITYDQKTHLLEIAVKGIDHLTRKPNRIAGDEGPGSLNGLESVDADGHHQIVTLASR